MFKLVFSLAVTVSCASAGLIASAQASCGGMRDTGTTFASCSYSYNIDQVHSGFLTVIASGLINEQGNIGGSADASAFGDRGTGFAGVSLSEDFILTVTGGSGDGFFVGCFSGFADPGIGGAMVFVNGSFGGSGGESSFGPLDTCGSQFNFLRDREPFTFGVSQILTAALGAGVSQLFTARPDSADARVHWGSANGDLFLVFDTAGNPINASFTLVPVPAPEPSSWSLLGIGMLFLLAMEFRGAFTNEPDRVDSRFYRTPRKIKKSCRSTA
jgi:hypothetical protein